MSTLTRHLDPAVVAYFAEYKNEDSAFANFVSRGAESKASRADLSRLKDITDIDAAKPSFQMKMPSLGDMQSELNSWLGYERCMSSKQKAVLAAKNLAKLNGAILFVVVSVNLLHSLL